MAYVTIEDRVDRLEALFGQFMTEMALINKRAEERHKAAEERHKEAEERNKAAEERHKAAEERMARFEQEMRDFKQEMRDFKQEMRDFKEDSIQFRKDMKKQWGDLSNKLGTIVEDILAPNLPRLAVDHFKLPEVEEIMVRYDRKNPKTKDWCEFDAIVAGPGYVILGEAKSSPSVAYADDFAKKIAKFGEFFPHFAKRKLIPIFGSWSIHPTVKKQLTKLGIYGMEMGEDTMQLINHKELDRKYLS